MLSSDLSDAFFETVSPSIFHLTDLNGLVRGTGFIFGDGYLLTNAHVTKNAQLYSKLGLVKLNQSRPASVHCPDLSICTFNVDEMGWVPLRLLDRFKSEKVVDVKYFIYDLAHSQIIELKPEKIACPKGVNYYAVQGDVLPGHGSSGSPVIKAICRLSQDRSDWDFQVVSMLYARISDRPRRLLAIDLLDELRQTCLLAIQKNTMSIFGSYVNQAMIDDYQQLLQSYHSPPIDPNTEIDNLEWLGGDESTGIVEFKASFLCTGLTKALAKRHANIHRLKQKTNRLQSERGHDILDCLKHDFKVLIDNIAINQICRGCPKMISSTELLRLDQDGLMLSVEDNTDRIALSGRTVSQVFARVVFSKPVVVSPDIIKRLLEESRDFKCPVVYLVDGQSDKRVIASGERGYYVTTDMGLQSCEDSASALSARH
tara:strand:+ start:2083 stop:3366 length:1284 start_codon:yes stop_codon:yes gene_type:complete